MADPKTNGGIKAPKEDFWKELMSGTMVTEKLILRNLGYLILLTILGTLYIGNRFHAESLTRQINKLQKEVRDLRSEALSTSADLMSVSKQSEVTKLVKKRGLGLEELTTPPFKIVVEQN
jgi:hypothetical protein